MSGIANWQAQIRIDIEDLKKRIKVAEGEINNFTNEDRKVKLDIDTKTLESAIQKLDKMLDSLGKGTGDFKQFENLSKELSSIVLEVQSLSKAFGKVDDSGAKTLLSSIQNIDKSLSELSQNILNVNKNISNMGGNTSGAVKQVENISNAYQDAAKEAEKLADVQSKIGQKTNISLTSDSTVEQQIKSELELNAEIEKRENIIRELQQLQEKLTVHEDFHGNDRYFADQLPTEEEIREADKRIKQLTGTNNIFNVDKLIQDRNEWLSEVKYSLEEYDDLIKANDQKALDEYTTRGLSRIGGAESFFGYEDNNFSIASKFVEEKEKIQNEINDLYTDLDKLDEKMNLDSNNSSVDNTVQSQEKLQSELKETQKQAEKTAQAVKESTTASTEQKKDAFPNADSTASVEKIADGFKEVKQNTEQATKVTEKYQRVLSQVGELGVDAKVSAMYQRNDGQLESVSWKAKRDDQGQILYDKNGNIDYDFNSTVISKYEQLEKIITTADNKLRDLQKSLKDTQNLNSNASTKNIEEQIQYQKDYIQLLEQTVKAISQQDEYLLYEQQIIDARAKAEKEYNLNQGTKSDISNAKQLASDEEKRQKSIEQTNRLLNKQQIIIDGIEKSYSKAANNDLDKAVNSQSDLAELANKKAEIQKLINQLTDQDRNSLNEDDFLLLEKYIAEYKQLAKDKLKANNPSKQELGGQELDVLLANQVTQYNKLISQSEKYGDATKEITNELKAQRDLIAEQDKNDVYVARSKKADGSELTANDYYNARDNYKIDKSIFSSYETDIKSASNMAKQEASNIQAEWDKNIKAIQDYMDAMTKLNNLKAKDKGTGSEANQIALQTQNVEELKKTAFEARQNLSSMQAENPDVIAWKQWVDMMELFVQASKGSAESAAKLKDVLDNIKAPSLDKYENKLASYQTKKAGYDATIARFKDGGWTSDEYLKNVQAVKDAVKKYEDLLSNIKAKGGITSEEDVQKLKEYESEIKKTISTVTNMSAAEKGYNFVSAQKELDKIHKLLAENSKMSSEAKAKIQAYYREIESGNPSMSLDKIHGEILKIYNAEVEAGRAGRSFFDTLKNSGFHQLAAQMAGMFGVYDVINLGKQAFSTVKELDYALVDLKKTTAMNSSELEQFYYDSNDVAKQMGVTTKEIIDQASSWSRLGYNSKQAATEMAKLSSQFALISPGMDTTTSQEGLVSIMKAWDIGYQDVKSQIMDDINALGNAMAEDNQDIVEGMERSAAALAAVGTSTKDAFALFSGIQEVLQNSEKSGTSLRSVALRLRSFDETTGEYSEDLANITGELADLTKTAEHAQGVSVFKPGSTTEFKSLVDYFREIADIWDEMSQKQQNDFLLKAFGRTQAQAGAALIQNFKGVEKALDVMDNAAGSSDKEMETAKQSITYKLNELKQTWVGTVQDIANRDDLGKIVDGLIDLSSAIGFVIDKLGLVGTVGLFGGAGTGIFKFIKNFDWVFKPYTKTLSNSF